MVYKMDLDKLENRHKKLPYPKSVFFIVTNEFCERFCYYGMRTILVLYLTNILLYSDADAKIVYHTFTMFVYFFPVLGAILSDSLLGKFRTILYVSCIYAAGSILVSLTAAEPLNIPQREFTILGLLLIALGSGGIKPCVSAFGGDQFILPQQEQQLGMFFSLFYMSINAGSLISTFLTPILRNDVHCFDADSCYPLAFAVPGILMVISIIIFALGKPLYTIKKPKGNVMVEVSKCVGHAIACKFRNRGGPAVDHWLDRAEPKYGQQLVDDIKRTLKVLVLYLPLPIFWALYDQQGSAWTIQAVRMDGDIGFYTILPDQMQVVNPLLIIGFIPLFTYAVYPVLAKCRLVRSPLQKMCAGGFLAAVAFVVSALVAIALEKGYPTLPGAGEVQLRIYDTTRCRYSFSTNIGLSSSIDMNYYVNKSIPVSGDVNVDFTFDPISVTETCPQRNLVVPMTEMNAYGLYINSKGVASFTDMVEKSDDGYPKIRTLIDNNATELVYRHTKKDYQLTVESGNTSLKSLPYPGTYRIEGSFEEIEVTAKLGGTYTVLINQEAEVYSVYTVTEPNNVNMLLLLPQYIIITAAEIMFSITGLEFSYSQAPSSMKSVLQALWLLTTAFGNLIIVVIEAILHFDKQSTDFFVYAGLMVVDVFIFMWLAIRYQYVEPVTSVSDLDVSEQAEGEKSKELTNGIDNPTFNNNTANY
ncbi:peptide transporter family 1-like isoform X2 [Cylas formicarius]|uniref:peptide transporter family 1-like isoform X2 n=1 Tax=Cylas formicarius TaxID=197179 RepID=UPI002958A031|nr:peptide transporter family 1-like isoform X2 [Cylas formicarius]